MDGDQSLSGWPVWSVVTLPVRIAWKPVAFLLSVALYLLAPAIYVVSAVFSFIAAVVDVIVGLQPLYSFFASAAFIGIVAGMALSLTSWKVASSLGMYDRADSRSRPGSSRPQLKIEEESPYESDWQLLSQTPTTGRRRKTQGLLSQTIHEEDDDSE